MLTLVAQAICVILNELNVTNRKGFKHAIQISSMNIL
jgi:hypothetical protein